MPNFSYTPAVWLGVFFLGFLGCAASAPSPPHDVMNDQEAPVPRRIAAMDAAVQAMRDGEAVALLDQVAFTPGRPFALRQAAMDRWAQRDLEGLAARLDRGLLQLNHWPMIEHALGIIEQHDLRGLLPAVLHSYARPSQRYADQNRPERKAIAALQSQPTITASAWGVVAQPERFSTRRRVAVWSLIVRLDADAATKLLTDAASHSRLPDDPLIDALVSSHRDLGILIQNREQALWAMHLRQPEHRAHWQHVARRVAENRPYHEHFHLRHLVLYRSIAGDAQAVRSAEQSRQHFTRQQGVARDVQHDVSALRYWDVALVERLQATLAQPGIAAALFAQADADQKDTTTEHGGVLTYVDGRPKAIAVSPVIRRHDNAYFTPQAGMDLLYTGLAHYHFHAQHHNNEAYAGPGGGDLKFARRTGAACVVLTFIDQNTLNADFYTDTGTIIDLGTLHRP